MDNLKRIKEAIEVLQNTNEGCYECKNFSTMALHESIDALYFKWMAIDILEAVVELFNKQGVSKCNLNLLLEDTKYENRIIDGYQLLDEINKLLKYHC